MGLPPQCSDAEEENVTPDARTQPLTEDQAREQHLYLSDAVGPNRSSRPGFVTTASTTNVVVIDYTCALHLGERGTIEVFNT